MSAVLVPLMSEAASIVVQQVLPDFVKWIEAKVSGGSTAEQAAASFRLLLDTADLTVDLAEDQKFGKPDPYTP